MELRLSATLSRFTFLSVFAPEWEDTNLVRATLKNTVCAVSNVSGLVWNLMLRSMARTKLPYE